MTPPTRNRPPTGIVIAAAILFIVLAVLEVMAGQLTPPASGPAAPWMTHLRQVDDALAKRDVGAAERAWRDAYAAAVASRRWEGMIEVGDVARRIGQATGTQAKADARARWTYRAALYRARADNSVDGVLRAAEVFSSLGDREVVVQCLRIAEHLASQARDPQARERVFLLSERLATNH
jgi:hypothetical protein